MRVLVLALLCYAGCGTASLDELPSPETCQWEYDVGRVNDVALTMEIAGVTAGSDVELGTTSDGRWGFAVDLRIATTDAITFPESVCSEVMGTANFEGGLSTRGLRFRRQADGSMLARNAIMDPGVMPSADLPFRGVVRMNYPISPSTIFGFETYSSAASTSVMVNLVNNVGFLSDAPDSPATDAAVGTDGSTPADRIHSCYGTTTPYCSQFDVTGNPPANTLNLYAPTWCPDDDVVSGIDPCSEPFNGQFKTAVCTMPVTFSWGTLVIRQFWYGPVDEATLRPDCEFRGEGATWMTL